MNHNVHSLFTTPDDLLPKLICNNLDKKIKVRDELEKNLRNCSSFKFSIAFINDSGLASLRQILLELKEKNIRGKLITSTYLGFNSPKTFQQLLELNNIDVHICSYEGFHPKGYIFKNNNDYKVLIGSSNLTQSALSTNQEWNLSLTSFLNEPITSQILEEFNAQWNNSFPLTQEWIDNYKKTYVNPELKTNLPLTFNFIPNKMQKEALLSLETQRKQNLKRSLLISATGTGKTFLAAFDIKSVNPNKVLFVVHRENIARAALNTFKKIFNFEKLGLFTGTQKDKDANFLFSTIQTIGKEEYLHLFKQDEFDYIVIDEVHHVGAPYYEKLLNYFNPKFLLGMTATPERNDGIDIYELFDHNIAYEIRLHQAMEYDLLCPFHYYGVSDLTINGVPIDDKSEFNTLVCDARVHYLIKTITKYKYSGDKVRGLIFVSRIDEAKQLSNNFNLLGFRTVALSAEDSDFTRRSMMDRLELEECDEALDYIFTVDIFNEGIDIPKVNQVVLLRPTQSAIIFIQQLGRGLRKDMSKEYVVIIDVIGNYEKNFLIPIALSGDMTYNKDSLRQFIHETSKLLPGASTISFDEISRKKIYKAIDVSNFSSVSFILDSYKQLRLKLGRIPTLCEFDQFNSIDPLLIFNNKALGSYYSFLKKYEPSFSIELSKLEELYLKFISIKLSAGKRIHEIELISTLLTHQNDVFSHLSNSLQSNYQVTLSDLAKITIINEFTQQFQTGSQKSTFKDALFIKINSDGTYDIHPQFKMLLSNNDFLNQLVDLINFSKMRYNSIFYNTYLTSDLVLYQKYTYEDVCRLLNWKQNIVPLNIGGYKFDKHSNTFPIFINYHKEDVHDSINYEDRFIDPNHISAITKSNRNLTSKDVCDIFNASKNGTQIHLFVRKNKDDQSSKEFYYLGLITPNDTPEEFIMKNTNQIAVKITYSLHSSVRSDIYNYLTDTSV